ncbi:hypothetical protein MATR_16610 [Marivirga tractuosa]|uniref:Uncharacterized protein n=1 Tax=Marivirga tractuosa (strain ATCC 23168 / DSM 4126 / NBRC 15989 / NCIMB 1408 / VKM B-1430 / H-43) TaxID=643867 RepID=E4TRW3_MARTH|nr:tetratricopeptide repeat protein [Marivirga tractuosa]ADR20714.1 hypothetical protein Ftrac_0712 [Marivirga tractuosa DSM 4126]BDD14836.1 hypothetical protein MATR_16610 [Marivirga tractuosa]
MKIKYLFLAILSTLFIGHIQAQILVEKIYTYEKFNLPAVKLDESFEGLSYSVRVNFEDDWSDEVKESVRSMLLESLTIPDMKRKEMNHNWDETFAKQQNEILVTVKFGKYSDRQLDEKKNSDYTKYGWMVKFKMPVTIEWHYRRFPDRNETYDFKNGLDDNGFFVFESDMQSENVHYASKDTIVSYANNLFFTGVGDHLKSKSDVYFPYTSEETIVLNSMKHRKTDFSRLEEGCEIAGEAISMMSNEDVYANEAASAKLDEAIGIFEEVYEEHKDNKRVKAYPVLNILTCQLLQGNITGAMQTVDRIQSMGSMYRMVVNDELVSKQKDLYDLHGISYR